MAQRVVFNAYPYQVRIRSAIRRYPLARVHRGCTSGAVRLKLVAFFLVEEVLMKKTILVFSSWLLVWYPTVGSAQTNGEDSVRGDAGYTNVNKCLRASQVRSFEVLSDRMVLLKGRGGRIWLSRLPRLCKGLQKNMAIRTSRNSSRLCANARFQARDRGMGIEVGASASCSFGYFESLSSEQAALIRREQG